MLVVRHEDRICLRTILPKETLLQVSKSGCVDYYKNNPTALKKCIVISELKIELT